MKMIAPADLKMKVYCLFTLLFLLRSPALLHAQLVADGQTVILDGVGTNIAGNVTVGTNGNFTLLIVTNGAAVTNSQTVQIGSSSLATHNRIVVGGPGSTWYNTGTSFNIGILGPSNELDILDGGTVTNTYGYLGVQIPSTFNTVLVSGAGSLWQSAYVNLGKQPGGANNQLIVTNGGSIVSTSGVLGTANGKNNSAIVTGPNSLWTNSAGLSIGAYGSNNWMLITNGGSVFSSAISGLGMLSSSSSSNLAVITDSGSSWTAGMFYIGQYGAGNQLMILNGGKVASIVSIIGDSPGTSNNTALVDGKDSLWTNLYLRVGNNGTGNTLIVTNGGRVTSDISAPSDVGAGAASSKNSVLITGKGSLWSSGPLVLGSFGASGNQLRVDKGGTLVSHAGFSQGAGNSNLVILTDTNSLLQCNGFFLSGLSTNNQCIISNGATFATVFNSSVTFIAGTSTRLTITGAGALWTNASDLKFGQFSNVLSITSGGTLIDNSGYIVAGTGPAPQPNKAIVAGANSTWKNIGDFHISDAKGQLFITNGGTLLASNSYVGESGSNNTVLVSGPGSLWTNQADFYLGSNSPNNQVVVTDFATFTAGTLFVGNSGGQNQFIVSNSGNVAIQGLLVGVTGNSPSNLVTLSGGTIMVGVSGVTLNQRATLRMSSGLLSTPYLTTEGIGLAEDKLILNGGTLQSGGLITPIPRPLSWETALAERLSKCYPAIIISPEVWRFPVMES